MSDPLATPARPAARARLSRRAAFWGLAATLGFLLFASSAPSPLYVVYQQQWGFSEITLTSVFAVYALALLGALLVAGSVSDHVGRRPTLLFALVLELAAMLLFAEAQGVAWLFGARILQGLCTGLAMGAISAALLDLQYGPDPTRLVYWLLVGTFAATVAVAAAMPETVSRDGRWLRSLRPRVAVPEPLRAAFIATIPCVAATWALGGLVLSLGPSLTAGVLGSTSHIAGGLSIFVMAGISALASIRLREAHARTTARVGLAALIVGVALALAALGADSIGLFLTGAAIAGLGFGPAFAGAFRALSTQAPAAQRAAFVSAILAVAYLAFSLPAVAAGAAVTQLGLQETANVYGAVLIVLAAIALGLSRWLRDPQSSLA